MSYESERGVINLIGIAIDSNLSVWELPSILDDNYHLPVGTSQLHI